MKQKLQANIEGFLGKPASLFGVMDKKLGVLNISVLASKKMNRQPDCILITNVPKVDHDFYADEVQLREAIVAYYRLKNGYADDNETPLLNFGSKVGSCDPSSTIELNGVSETGMDYRISPDISNQQVAALMMCLYITKMVVIDDCLSMLDDINEIMDGHWISI